MDNKTGKFYQGTLPLDRFTGVSIEQNAKIFVHCKGNNERVKEVVELLEQMGYLQVVLTFGWWWQQLPQPQDSSE